jgi:simple sugar transport system ATP-binding protein
MEPYIRMVGIKKAFPGVVAVNGVNFDVYKGEIHALLGENGAGKTTLMSILYGIYRRDAGEIYVDGRKVNIRSSNDALKLGIGMVHQHFSLIPYFTVLENVAIGLERPHRRLDRGELSRMLVEEARRYGFEVDPNAYVHQLSAGQKQIVEILKMLLRGVSVLILDEPTSALTPIETEELFIHLKRMKEEGKAVVLITHKLYEVIDVADRVTVLRRGSVVYEALRGDFDETKLIEAMVGKGVELRNYVRADVSSGSRLEVRNLSVKGNRGEIAVQGITLEVRGGRIVGIAGVAGNGQKELAEAIFGIRRPVSGSILIDGQDITRTSVRERLKRGIEMIPEERIGMGVAPQLSLSLNSILHDHWWEPFVRNLTLQRSRIREFAGRIIRSYNVVARSEEAPASSLSGGNLQKFIVGRSLLRGVKFLIAMNPTSGLDVASTDFVRRTLTEFRNSGGGVLLISDDLDELFELSDVIHVIYKGRINGTFVPPYDRIEIGRSMMGRS